MDDTAEQNDIYFSLSQVRSSLTQGEHVASQQDTCSQATSLGTQQEEVEPNEVAGE